VKRIIFGQTYDHCCHPDTVVKEVCSSVKFSCFRKYGVFPVEHKGGNKR
jgi:hypothetical protein